jgi:hypothetical protein
MLEITKGAIKNGKSRDCQATLGTQEKKKKKEDNGTCIIILKELCLLILNK